MKWKYLLATTVIGSLSFMNAEAAVGSFIGSAEATLDWSTFTVRSIALDDGPGPSLTWSNQYTSVYSDSYSPDDYQYVDTYDWNTALQIQAGNIATYSVGGADLSSVHSYSIDTDGSTASNTSGNVTRSGEFSVTGAGLLLFTVDYSLDATMPDPAEIIDPTSNAATVRMFINPVINPNQTFSSEDNITVGMWQPGSDHRTGKLSLGLLVEPDQQFYFTAIAETRASVSAVPLPQAIWFFGTGLMGLLSVAKRKKDQ